MTNALMALDRAAEALSAACRDHTPAAQSVLCATCPVQSTCHGAAGCLGFRVQQPWWEDAAVRNVAGLLDLMRK